MFYFLPTPTKRKKEKSIAISRFAKRYPITREREATISIIINLAPNGRIALGSGVGKGAGRWYVAR